MHERAGAQLAFIPYWCCSPAWCRICGHEYVAVYPADIVNECAMQCPNCDHHASQPKEKYD